MTCLIIGYGNTLRRDDGLGYYAAEQVAQWELEGVRSLPCHQLTPELAADIAQVEKVIFVDATAPSDQAPTEVTVERLTAEEEGIDMGHGLSPRSLLILTHMAYQTRPEAYHILIPAETFDFGETLSDRAHAGLAEALTAIQQIIDP
ncbi:MAG: hydrogenase maturation protease [Elainellaceae cyanobacterium]